MSRFIWAVLLMAGMGVSAQRMEHRGGWHIEYHGTDAWILNSDGKQCAAIIRRPFTPNGGDVYWFFVYTWDRAAAFNRKNDAIEWAKTVSPQCRAINNLKEKPNERGTGEAKGGKG